jgi:predicted lipoprotein with Yx(FWY)xxD motif
MSAKRASAIVALLVVIGAVLFYLNTTETAGNVVASGAEAPTASSTGGAAATSAVQLELTSGTASANNVTANTGDFFNGPRNDPAAMRWVQLTAAAAGPLNPVVVNGAGRTVYRFDKDSANPPRSNCDNSCVQTWEPIVVQPGARVFVDGVSSSDVGTVKRTDGTNQVTLKGWPIYLYTKDTKAGDVNGHGVGNVWFAISPDGQKAAQPAQGLDTATQVEYKTGTARQNNAPANTGDFYRGPRNNPAAMKWVQLTAGSAGGHSPIVHNALGVTFYRFDKDTARPSVSNCNGACTNTWEPVLVQHGSRIFVDGVSTAQVGIITRADGTRQVTLGGWPLYLYTGDAAPGDIKGEGVGGQWFAISPQGKKA